MRRAFPTSEVLFQIGSETADDIMDTENNCTMNAILLKQPFVIGTYSLYRFPGQWLTNQTTMR